MDIIAYPLGKFMKFIYDTVAFNNYGLAIIFFTIVVKLALLPLTLKQLKSSGKMQELQPVIADIQKRYKDDKEKMNQEMMKVYQENHYNPASGCLPLIVQMPILITLYWVIVQPLKFMLGKSADVTAKLFEVASKGLNLTGQTMVTQKELVTLNYFNENRGALSQVTGLLEESQLIDFNNFLGLHLGETATFDIAKLFGDKAYIFIPLFILAILATLTTFISTKLTMPKKNTNSGSKQSAPASSMTNSMMYIGPVMTLVFSFQMPAGVILYWMIGYVVSIFQQLYINKFVLNKNKNVDQKNITGKNSQDAGKTLGSGNEATGGNAAAGNAGSTEGKQLNAGGGTKKNYTLKGGPGGNKGGNKGGSKKNGAK